MILPRQFWGEAARQEFVRSVESLIARHGGHVGVRKRMIELGMGRLAHSWNKHGSFEPISGEQLHQLFGTGVLRAFAAKLNIQPRDLVRQLSSMLPKVMARLSP